jgi:hexosaminidase
MSWRGTEGGIAAAQQNHYVVMSPTSHCYFDYYQGDQATEPLAIGGFLPLEKVYEFEPVPTELSPAESQYILGAQGNVWTEYIITPEDVEYMSLPRMSALAEVVWSAKKHRNLENFRDRMSQHYMRLAEMGANYYQPPLLGFFRENIFIDETIVNIQSQRSASEVCYTLDGTDPTKESPLVRGPIRISDNVVLKAREFLPTGYSSRVYEGKFIKQKPFPAKEVDTSKNGIRYQYFVFDQPIDTAGALNELQPEAEGSMTHITFHDEEFPEYFGLIFSGYVKIPTEGVYTFRVSSNDGSRLFIDNQLIVDNDGWHGARERYGQIALQAGLHPLQVYYFQAGGGKALQIFLEGPGLPKQEIVEELLFYN